MLAASHAWGHGEYYDYGWFVPPAVMYLATRRWRETEAPARLPGARMWLGMAMLLMPWIIILRVLSHADPSWRLPVGLLGGTALAYGHLLLAYCYGWRTSARYVWISLLLASAIPWPSLVEKTMVRELTGAVVQSVSEVFQLLGKPVEVLGDRLQLHDVTVEVTDGCSGVRSFQSFLMATWFFVELQRLRVERAITLLACACAFAFLVNMGRTYALAHIRFNHGEEAFDRAHDSLGLLSFLLSGLVFYLLSGWLATERRRTVVKTTTTTTTTA